MLYKPTYNHLVGDRCSFNERAWDEDDEDDEDDEYDDDEDDDDDDDHDDHHDDHHDDDDDDGGGGGGEDEKTWRTMVCRWYQIAISVRLDRLDRLDLRIQVGKLCEAADWSCPSLHILGDLAMFSHVKIHPSDEFSCEKISKTTTVGISCHDIYI